METSQTQASFDSRSAFMETAAVVASGTEPLIARLLFTLDAVAGEDGSFGQAVGTLYVGDVPRGSLTETAFRFPPVNFRHIQQQAFEFGILPGQPFSFGAALRSTANGTKLALVDAKLDLQLSILDLNRNPLDLPILTDVPEPHTGCMILAGGLLFVIAWFRLPLMRNLMVAPSPALR